jgi:hypothetical protein
MILLTIILIRLKIMKTKILQVSFISIFNKYKFYIFFLEKNPKNYYYYFLI